MSVCGLPECSKSILLKVCLFLEAQNLKINFKYKLFFLTGKCNLYKVTYPEPGKDYCTVARLEADTSEFPLCMLPSDHPAI